LKRQRLLTKDNIVIDIDTVVYFRIVEPSKAVYKLVNINLAVIEVCYATLRTICGEHVM